MVESLYLMVGSNAAHWGRLRRPQWTPQAPKKLNTSSFSSSSSTGVCLDGRPLGRHFWRVLSQLEVPGEPVHLKCASSSGKLRTGQNKKASAISDLETMHPTQNIFSDFGAPGNRNGGGPRMPWVLRKSDIFSRPASSRSRFSGSREESREFSSSWEDSQRKIKDFQGFERIPTAAGIDFS